MKKARSLTVKVKRVVVMSALFGFLVTIPLGLMAYSAFEFVNAGSELKTSAAAVIAAHRSQLLVGDSRAVELQIRKDLRLSTSDVVVLTDEHRQPWLAGFDSPNMYECEPIGSVCREASTKTVRGYFPIYFDEQNSSLWGYLYVQRTPATDWSGAMVLASVFSLGMLIQLGGIYLYLNGSLRKISLAIAAWSERLSRDPKSIDHQMLAPYSEFDPVESAIANLNSKIAQLESIARSEGALETLRGFGHDILNPVARMKRIIGVAQMQADGSLVLDHELSNGLDSNLKRLSTYAEQLKVLYKKELGEFDREARVTNISDEVERLVEELKFDSLVIDKSLTLMPIVAANCFAEISPSALSRVVENLCTNAIFASKDKGRIEVSVERSSSDIQISVVDHGCGMPVAIRSRVFESGFTSKENKGTGLGLFVVKQVCEQYRGRIDFQSEVGKGSTFTISLPHVRTYELSNSVS